MKGIEQFYRCAEEATAETGDRKEGEYVDR
jgi:hypothetical protein